MTTRTLGLSLLAALAFSAASVHAQNPLKVDPQGNPVGTTLNLSGPNITGTLLTARLPFTLGNAAGSVPVVQANGLLATAIVPVPPASAIAGLATVATSGRYTDLQGLPYLGTTDANGNYAFTTTGAMTYVPGAEAFTVDGSVRVNGDLVAQRLTGAGSGITALNPGYFSFPSLTGVGDSLIGDGIGGQVGIMTMLAGTFPFTAAPHYVNGSMPGHGIVDILAAYPGNVHPYTPVVTGDAFCYTYCLAGINDCATADSAATIYARLLSLWAVIKADGCFLMASTIPANNAATIYNPAKIRQLNALIAGDPSKYDLLIPADAILGTSYATINDGYNVHPLTGGHQAVAATILARLHYPALQGVGTYAPALTVGGAFTLGTTSLSDNNGSFTIAGRFNADGGRITSDGGGLLTAPGLNTSAINDAGNLIVNGVTSLDNGGITTNGAGTFTNLKSAGLAVVAGTSSFDNGAVHTDGGGALTAAVLTVIGGNSVLKSLTLQGDSSNSGDWYGQRFFGTAFNGPLVGNASTATTASAAPLGGITGMGSRVQAAAASPLDGNNGLASHAALVAATSGTASLPAITLIKSIATSGEGSDTVAIPGGYHHLRILTSLSNQYSGQTAILAAWNGVTTAASYTYEEVDWHTNSTASTNVNPQTGGTAQICLGQANGSDASYPSEFETVVGLKSQTALARGQYYLNGYPNLTETTSRYVPSAALTSLVISTYSGFAPGGVIAVYGY